MGWNGTNRKVGHTPVAVTTTRANAELKTLLSR